MTITMNRNYDDIYFQTTDLSLAATIALSLPLDSVDKTIPTKAQFIFKRSKELDELIESYWKRELKVEPQMYFQSLKILKNRLYSSE